MKIMSKGDADLEEIRSERDKLKAQLEDVTQKVKFTINKDDHIK